jgi:hypothetical protein
MNKIFLSPVVVMLVFCCACGGQKGTQNQVSSTPSFQKNTPQDLSFDTVSKILKDMKLYQDSVHKLDQNALQSLDKNYQGVIFKTEQKPLFLNVYPDAANKSVIFLLVPKDPTTGSNYLLPFEKKLPVVDTNMIEIQVRTKDPDKPFNCTLQVPDPAAYMSEYASHQLVARYEFTKKFLQSGTYDFDALTVPSYRTRGYPFIVFDYAKAEVVDQTANLTASCRQQ